MKIFMNDLNGRAGVKNTLAKIKSIYFVIYETHWKFNQERARKVSSIEYSILTAVKMNIYHVITDWFVRVKGNGGNLPQIINNIFCNGLQHGLVLERKKIFKKLYSSLKPANISHSAVPRKQTPFSNSRLA